MDSLQFCYWLQGFFELASDRDLQNLDDEQVKIIKDHLQLVFNKVTPTYKIEEITDTIKYPYCGSLQRAFDPAYYPNVSC